LTPRRPRRRGEGRRRPIGLEPSTARVLAERQRSNDRDIRPAGLAEGDEQLLEIRERLQDEDVDAALEEPLDLLSE
jgi:hypothetical protein